MAKTKKKKKENEIIEFMPCEWVVQFDNDSPQRFAYADETTEGKEVILQLKNDNQSIITFTDTKSGKQFKIFARKPL
jgi:hypothetical protein